MTTKPTYKIVHVRPHHIEVGEPYEPAYCPIALAIQEAMDDPLWRAGVANAFRTRDNHVTTVTISKRAQKFMRQFDALRIMPPFAFRLYLSDGVQTKVR